MARAIVFAADLDDVIAKTRPRAGIRWCEPADRDRLAAAGMREIWLDPRTSDGAQIVVAEEGETIVGCLAYLANDSTRHYDWLTLELRPGYDVYSFGLVRPEARGQGFFASMKGFAARHFASKGYRRDLSVVAVDNEASMRAHARAGAVPVARLARARIGNVVFVWHGRALRHVGWRRNDAYLLSV